MRKSAITKVFAAVLALMLVFTSVLSMPTSAEAAAKPSKITLAATKRTMSVGEKYTLKVKSVTPKGASKSVKFKSSNSKVAAVNSKGQITAKKKGTATITVTSKSNSKAKATCKITVKEVIKKITVTNSVDNTVAVRIGKTLALKTAVEPSDAGNKKLTYSSNKKSVATVDKKGKVKGKKAGTAKITIKAAEGKAKATITVKVPAKNKVVKSVTVSPANKTVNVGEKFKLSAAVAPKNAAVKLVSYKSSNEKVATVDGKGNVTAKGAGTASITVTTLDGNKKASCAVTVNPILASSVTLDKTSATLNVGQTDQLTATVEPANAGNKNVTWKSSNESIVEVSGSGNTITVTGKAAGNAEVTATAADGSGKSAVCAITVNAPAPSTPTPTPTPTPIPEAASITMPSEVTMYANEAKSVTATVTPASKAAEVTYASSNETYLKVGANGELQVQPGILGVPDNTVTVNVTASVDGKTAAAAVTIILRENAKTADTDFYKYELKGEAVEYEVVRGGVPTVITKDNIAKTMANLTGYQWSNTTLRDNWDDQSFINLMAMLVFPDSYKEGVTGTVTDDVMTITRTVNGTSKTAVLTLAYDETTETSSLTVQSEDKPVVHFTDISVEDADGIYQITAKVQVDDGNSDRNLLVKIDKQGAYAEAYRQTANGELLIAGVSSNAEGGYTIQAKSDYVEELGMSEFMANTVIMNSYIPHAE